MKVFFYCSAQLLFFLLWCGRLGLFGFCVGFLVGLVLVLLGVGGGKRGRAERKAGERSFFLRVAVASLAHSSRVSCEPGPSSGPSTSRAVGRCGRLLASDVRRQLGARSDELSWP